MRSVLFPLLVARGHTTYLVDPYAVDVEVGENVDEGTPGRLLEH